MTAEIKLNRPNKIYFENVGRSVTFILFFFIGKFVLQETVSGLVQIHCPTEAKHDGITATIDGTVNLLLGNKSVGIIEAFTNSVKPIQLLNVTLPLASAGKLPQGISEIAFEFPLACTKEPKKLYETYHGIFVNVNYVIKCDIKRSFLAKSIQKVQQFVIQYRPTKQSLPSKDVNFSISPETLQKTAKERISIPRFLITGHLDAVDCCITKPFTGHVSCIQDSSASASTVI